MTDLEKTEAYLKMNKKERQKVLIDSWYIIERFINTIEYQLLYFINHHTNVIIDEDVIAQSDEVKYLKLKAVDPITFRTLFEKVITL